MTMEQEIKLAKQHGYESYHDRHRGHGWCAFKRKNTHIWKIKEGWVKAFLLNDNYTKHKKYKTLEEALSGGITMMNKSTVFDLRPNSILNVKDTCTFLGIKPSYLYNLVYEGKIKPLPKVNGKKASLKFLKADLEKYVGVSSIVVPTEIKHNIPESRLILDNLLDILSDPDATKAFKVILKNMGKE